MRILSLILNSIFCLIATRAVAAGNCGTVLSFPVRLTLDENSLIDQTLEKLPDFNFSAHMDKVEVMDAAGLAQEREWQALLTTVWFKKEGLGVGVHKISGALGGDELVLVNAQKQRIPLRKYPAGTVVDTFAVTPDQTRAVVVRLNNRYPQAAVKNEKVVTLHPSIYVQLEPVRPSVEVVVEILRLSDGQVIREFELGATDRDYCFTCTISKMPQDGFKLVLTDDSALLFSEGPSLSEFHKLLMLNGPAKALPLIDSRHDLLDPVLFNSGSIAKVTVSPNGRFVVGHGMIYEERVSGGRRIEGLFVRDLLLDPLVARETSLFKEEHQVTKFGDMGFAGGSPEYQFSPDSRTLLILGNQLKVAVIRDLEVGRKWEMLDSLDSRLQVNAAVFSADSSQFYLAGHIFSANATLVNPSPGFFKGFNSATLEPLGPAAAIYNGFTLASVFASSSQANRLLGLGRDKTSIYLLNAISGKVLKRFRLDMLMQPSEHLKILWFDSKKIYAATSSARVVEFSYLAN
jgi:hypothetical protein